MAALLPVFIASGLEGSEFARRNGLTPHQGKRLLAMSRESRAQMTASLTDSRQQATGALVAIARDHAETLTTHGAHCARFVARINAEIEAAGGDMRAVSIEDLNRLRYAWSVVGRLNQIFKPRESSASVDKPGEVAAGPPHLVGSGAIPAGMLTISETIEPIEAATAGEDLPAQ